MGNFQSNDGHTDAGALDRSVHGFGHLLRKKMKSCQLIWLHVEDVVYLFFLGTTSTWPFTKGMISKNAM